MCTPKLHAEALEKKELLQSVEAARAASLAEISSAAAEREGASGVPPAFETAGAASVEEDSGDDAWFRGMWLSNGDFLRLFGAAALSDRIPGSGFHCVNAMSANTNARWSLDETEALLGVRPRDDAASYRDAIDAAG